MEDGWERVIEVHPLDADTAIHLCWSDLVSVWASGSLLLLTNEEFLSLHERLVAFPLTPESIEDVAKCIGAGKPRKTREIAHNFSNDA